MSEPKKHSQLARDSRPRQSRRPAVFFLILPVCLVVFSGCGPVGRTAGRAVAGAAGKLLRGNWDDVAAFMRKGAKAVKGQGDDAVRAAQASRPALLVARVAIQQMRQAYATANAANKEARNAIERLPETTPPQQRRFLEAMYVKNDTLLDRLVSEMNESGDTAIRDKTAQALTKSFEKIAREQATIARLAESIG